MCWAIDDLCTSRAARRYHVTILKSGSSPLQIVHPNPNAITRPTAHPHPPTSELGRHHTRATIATQRLFAHRYVQHTSSALPVRRPITCDVQLPHLHSAVAVDSLVPSWFVSPMRCKAPPPPIPPPPNNTATSLITPPARQPNRHSTQCQP